MRALQGFGAGLGMHGAERGRRGVRWLLLAGAVAPLAGCVTPSYPPYPTPLYLPPPYVIQPPYAAQPPGPVPLYPLPEPRRQPAPVPEDVEAPVGVPATPEPEPPAAYPTAPTAPPDDAVPSPPNQAGPGADALQGFRPMRGQSRPGI